MLSISTKSFDQLTTAELYDLLQLRSEIFVVEQECVYQDVDGKDQKALHILGVKNDKIVAYARAFKAGDYMAQACIGRVLVKEGERQHGCGYDIMNASIKAVEERFGENWWNDQVKEAIRNNVDSNIKRDEDSGFTIRSENKIDYTTFGELSQIVSGNWEAFEVLFKEDSVHFKEL